MNRSKKPMGAGDSRVHPAALSEEMLLRACSVTRQRRSGPGGQHRNKVETAVVITHEPTGVVGQASERRSQEENRRMAVQRLRVNLALNDRRPRDVAAEPSPLWRSRVRAGRISVSISHADFPALLAEALDTLAAANWNVATAAESLQLTASQLTKFLALEPAGLGLLNTHRKRLGLKPLMNP